MASASDRYWRMDIIKKPKIYIFLLLLFFVPFYSHGATYQWTQSLYGTGNKALVTISSSTVNITAGGGSTRHLYKVTAGSVNGGDTPLSSNSFPSLPLSASSLDANSAYLLTSDNQSSASAGVYNAHVGQILGADNTSSAYPDAGAGFFGFVYFKTDSNKKIFCYSTNLGANTSPYGAAFQNCDNYLFQNVTSNVSTTTNYVIDTASINNAISSSSDKTVTAISVVAFAMMFTGLLSALIIMRRK